jgi:hypothetical protein
MGNVKNDCKTCPILDYGPCPLFDYAHQKKGLDGIQACEMRTTAENMIDKIKEDMRKRYGSKKKQ